MQGSVQRVGVDSLTVSLLSSPLVGLQLLQVICKMHVPSAVTLLFFVVQSLSHIHYSVTPQNAAHQASLSFTICQNLLKLRSIESVMPSNHLIL